MKGTYEERAKKFIAQIYPLLKNAYNSHSSREAVVNSFNHWYHRNVKYAHGLTRYALITSDYVVKVDYDAHYVERYGGCEKELQFYAQAEADGFSYMFAKITLYQYEGVNFYIMPRIHGIGRHEYDADEYMTPEEYDWCLDHNLSDLHNGNYGWKDGHIVIIDYAAYY